MNKDLTLSQLVQEGDKYLMPSLSVDCVIFGFHENELKVLLNRIKGTDEWALPGGFIFKEEGIETAASRVLQERTGMKDIFLQQFHVFGEPNRTNKDSHLRMLKKEGVPINKNSWFLKRFITVGYYALVDFATVVPEPDQNSEACEWIDIHNFKSRSMILDHDHILNKALETLRLQLNHQPIGYNLLQAKFTMPELQKLYETILDKKLDRRNFQRRIIAYGFVKKLKETRKGGAHKAPYLYSFDLRKYKKALTEGLQGGW
jgi:ADP-ribose pyrophosphatase YjhB (NUDIX family)